MNKEFIPYQEALALKELGFDELCFGSYVKLTETQNTFFMNNVVSEIDRETPLHESLITKAPLYQQAFRWFREKYGLIGHVRESWSFDNIMEYVSQINGTFVNHSFISDKPINRFNTYEEAELACLKKLIEIVKGDNK